MGFRFLHACIVCHHSAAVMLGDQILWDDLELETERLETET